MPQDPSSEPTLTLASLRRRRAGRSRVGGGQADLFPVFATDGGAAEGATDPQTFAQVSEQTVFAPESDVPFSSFSRPLEALPRVVPSQLAIGQTLVTQSVSVETAAPFQEQEPAPQPDSEPDPEPDASPSPNRRSEAWTVSGLVRHIRGLVERGYGQITVEGEISNWRPAGSGHCYFTIKDTGAQLSAVLFRRQASLLRFPPSDGDAVRCHGQLSVYENRGQMQLIVEWMEQVGFGAQLAEVQRLKERLRREGLFDRKRPLPPFPRCIGVVTSLQGAALRDIIKVCQRRHAAVQLLIYPAAVQGPNCPAEIAAGLRWFAAHPERAEVVLVARGGGSWEDLHGFDDERVARALAACQLPVITGIGHATDATVADAAADVCAPTPSAAAELLTAAQHRVEERILRLHSRLLRAGAHELLRAGSRLARLSAPVVLRRVEDGLNRQAQRLDELGLRAEAAHRHLLQRRHVLLRAAEGRLARQSPSVQLASRRQGLVDLQARLLAAAGKQWGARRNRVSTASTRLSALSPLRVLERGYALVYDPEGHLLRTVDEVAVGTQIRARLAEGDLVARVLARGGPSSKRLDPES